VGEVKAILYSEGNDLDRGKIQKKEEMTKVRKTWGRL
jgi:hypothetical protein